MALPFSVTKVLSGSPNAIFRILGMGLIPFVGPDGNMYVIDVKGNIQLLSDYIEAGSSSTRLTMTVGSDSYYNNNALIATGNPAKSISGSNTLELTDFSGDFVSFLSIGGISIADGPFTWDAQTATLELTDNVFTDGDVIVILLEKKSSGGGGGGGSLGIIYYDQTITATAGQTQFPAIASDALKNATNTLVFYNDQLISSGNLNTQYQNTPQLGYITKNLAAGAGEKIRIIGYTLS